MSSVKKDWNTAAIGELKKELGLRKLNTYGHKRDMVTRLEKFEAAKASLNVKKQPQNVKEVAKSTTSPRTTEITEPQITKAVFVHAYSGSMGLKTVNIKPFKQEFLCSALEKVIEKAVEYKIQLDRDGNSAATLVFKTGDDGDTAYLELKKNFADEEVEVYHDCFCDSYSSNTGLPSRDCQFAENNFKNSFTFKVEDDFFHRQVILENLPESVTEQNIEETFPEAFNIILFAQDQSSKGIGTFEMKSEAKVDETVKKSTNCKIGNSKILVSKFTTRQNKWNKLGKKKAASKDEEDDEPVVLKNLNDAERMDICRQYNKVLMKRESVQDREDIFGSEKMKVHKDFSLEYRKLQKKLKFDTDRRFQKKIPFPEPKHLQSSYVVGLLDGTIKMNGEEKKEVPVKIENKSPAYVKKDFKVEIKSPVKKPEVKKVTSEATKRPGSFVGNKSVPAAKKPSYNSPNQIKPKPAYQSKPYTNNAQQKPSTVFTANKSSFNKPSFNGNKSNFDKPRSLLDNSFPVDRNNRGNMGARNMPGNIGGAPGNMGRDMGVNNFRDNRDMMAGNQGNRPQGFTPLLGNNQPSLMGNRNDQPSLMGNRNDQQSLMGSRNDQPSLMGNRDNRSLLGDHGAANMGNRDIGNQGMMGNRNPDFAGGNRDFARVDRGRTVGAFDQVDALRDRNMGDSRPVGSLLGSRDMDSMGDRAPMGSLLGNRDVGNMGDRAPVGNMFANRDMGNMGDRAPVGGLLGNRDMGNMNDRAPVGSLLGNRDIQSRDFRGGNMGGGFDGRSSMDNAPVRREALMDTAGMNQGYQELPSSGQRPLFPDERGYEAPKKPGLVENVLMTLSEKLTRIDHTRGNEMDSRREPAMGRYSGDNFRDSSVADYNRHGSNSLDGSIKAPSLLSAPRDEMPRGGSNSGFSGGRDFSSGDRGVMGGMRDSSAAYGRSDAFDRVVGNDFSRGGSQTGPDVVVRGGNAEYSSPYSNTSDQFRRGSDITDLRQNVGGGGGSIGGSRAMSSGFDRDGGDSMSFGGGRPGGNSGVISLMGSSGVGGRSEMGGGGRRY